MADEMRRRPSYHSLSSSGSYSGIVLKRTPLILEKDDGDEAIDGPLVDPRPKAAPPISRWTTLKTRSLFGALMICGLYVILLIGPLAIITLIAAVQTLVFKEVISIAHSRSVEKKLPWFRTITWYIHCSLRSSTNTPPKVLPLLHKLLPVWGKSYAAL